MRSMLKSDRSVEFDLNKSKLAYNQESLSPKEHKQRQSFEEVIETFNIYLRSAIDLKNNLSFGRNTSFNQRSPYQGIDKIDSNEQMAFILTKVDFFIKSCENQLKKIHKNIENASISQIESMSQNYHKVLGFIKDKYAQLLKESYRTLNLENIQSENYLTDQDKKIVKQNRKRKLKQINELQKEMETLWESNPMKETDIDELSQISFNNNFVKSRKRELINDEEKKQQKKSNEKEQKSFIVTLEEGKSRNKRNLQVLGLEIDDLNLRELAKQELQKEFLAIRVQAYNMYERYMSHQHNEVNESLRFLKEEQQILATQVEEQAKLSESIKQEYGRLQRQLSEIKTINELIRKRYVIRESIRIDSEEGLYE